MYFKNHFLFHYLPSNVYTILLLSILLAFHQRNKENAINFTHKCYLINTYQTENIFFLYVNFIIKIKEQNVPFSILFLHMNLFFIPHSQSQSFTCLE